MVDDLSVFQWEVYGLADNPFDTRPISFQNRRLTFDVFVGRSAETHKLENVLYSSSSTRTLVFGERGVGKTSFVNYVRNKNNEKYFTPSSEIEIQRKWDETDFLKNTIIHSYYTLVQLKKSKNSFIDDKFIADFAEKIGLEVKTDSLTAGISIGLISAAKTSGKTNSVLDNPRYLRELFDNLLTKIVESGKKGAIFHYNNLDRFDDEQELSSFLESIRDIVLTENAHFIFVGNRFTADVFKNTDMFNRVLDDRIIINPIDISELKETVKRRFLSLKTPNGHFISPCYLECVDALYMLYNGNTSYIFKSLKQAIIKNSENSPKTLAVADMKTILRGLVNERLSQISPRAKTILLHLLKKKRLNNSALAKDLSILAQNVSAYMKQLQGVDLVFSVKEGRQRFFEPSEVAAWLLLDGAGKSNHRRLSEYS